MTQFFLSFYYFKLLIYKIKSLFHLINYSEFKKYTNLLMYSKISFSVRNCQYNIKACITSLNGMSVLHLVLFLCLLCIVLFVGQHCHSLARFATVYLLNRYKRVFIIHCRKSNNDLETMSK